MSSLVKRNIPIFISVLLHIIAVIFFYLATVNYNPESTNFIEFSFEGSGGSPGGGAASVIPEEKDEKLNTEKKTEEDVIPSKEKTNEKKVVSQAATNKTAGTTGAPNGNGAGGSGTGGTGTGSGGSGTGTGSSFGIPIPAAPKPKDETYYVAVDEMPEPFGGIEAIKSKVIYPAAAKQKGISGTVFVLAFVDENGVVRKTLLTKGIGFGCDEAAMNAVFRTRFKAGRQNGRPVKVQIQIPVPVTSR
jgi:TonB family protein